MHRWETDATAFWQFGVVYGRAPYTPEKRLLVAVLLDALLQFEKLCNSRERRAAQTLAELRSWFFGGDERWPFSFENVCAHLHLEPDAIRDRLARLDQARRGRMPQGRLGK